MNVIATHMMYWNIVCHSDNECSILSKVIVPKVVDLVFREFVGGDFIQFHSQMIHSTLYLEQAANCVRHWWNSLKPLPANGLRFGGLQGSAPVAHLVEAASHDVGDDLTDWCTTKESTSCKEEWQDAIESYWYCVEHSHKRRKLSREKWTTY